MSFSNALIVHALRLVVGEHSGPEREEVRDISMRRAVSAAYYALFHHLNAAAVRRIAPNVPAGTNQRIQRWFEHAEMKRVCGRFIKPKLDQPLLDLIGESASLSLQDVARNFIQLQEARHGADYDLSYTLTSAEARQLVLDAVHAIASWNVIEESAEANIFILSLLMWKNWEKERV